MRHVLIAVLVCALVWALLLSCSSTDKAAPSAPVSAASPMDTVGPFMSVSIEKELNVMMGQDVTVSVVVDTKRAFQLGAFDFLIEYDDSALSLTEVSSAGTVLFDSCGWEYFNYAMVPSGPRSRVRVVALAEINNGGQHPPCFAPPAETAELFKLKFFVINDRTLECQFVPIRFYWQYCGDNFCVTPGGDTLLISRYVYEIDRIENGTVGFPTYFGAQDSCVGVNLAGPTAVRAVDFYNGGIQVACAESIDVRGDVNLNGISCELADLTLFMQFFMHGLSVFTINAPGQIASTDVNADGLTLSVADYMTMADIVTGNSQPGPPAVVVTCQFAFSGDTLWVDSALGAAFILFNGDVTPDLLADSMAMYYNFDGTYTRVLVTPPLDPIVYELSPRHFSGAFLIAHGTLVSIEAARPDGRGVIGKLLPEAFNIGQNFPNPFDRFTTIPFRMGESGRYTITIFNAQGQQMTQFSDSVEAGFYTVEWDSGDAPAGVYTYLLTGRGGEQKRVMIKTE